MEIVEEPLRGRGDGLAAVDVIGQDAIGRAQGPRVVVDAAMKGPAARPPARGNGKLCGQATRALLEPFDVQELGAKRAREGRGRSGAYDRASAAPSPRDLAAPGLPCFTPGGGRSFLLGAASGLSEPPQSRASARLIDRPPPSESASRSPFSGEIATDMPAPRA